MKAQAEVLARRHAREALLAGCSFGGCGGPSTSNSGTVSDGRGFRHPNRTGLLAALGTTAHNNGERRGDPQYFTDFVDEEVEAE